METTMPDQDQNQLDARRRRLCYRAWHRGFLEMDMLLGRFADSHVETFDESQLQRLELLLNQPDPDIYAWYCRRLAVPEHQENDVTNLFLNFSLPS
jgi:antitoxin CptB